MTDPRNLGMMTLAAIVTLTFGTLTPAIPALAQGSLLDDDDDDDDDHPCMTSNGMRQFLAGKGFYDIKLNSPIGSIWQATASLGSQTYLVWVDTCYRTIQKTTKLGAR